MLYYTLSYPGDVPEGSVTYIVKGGTRCGTSTITGPAIDANICAEAPECDNAEDCDDGVDCTDDICDADVCVYQQNDANCDDGCHDEELQIYETSETPQSTANCLVFSLVLLVTFILF